MAEWCLSVGDFMSPAVVTVDTPEHLDVAVDVGLHATVDGAAR